MEPNKTNIRAMLKQHDAEGGNQINESLSKLFASLDDEENKYEVTIKVAALNQIYSTSIQYIKPVVSKIIENIDNTHNSFSLDLYINLVDEISTVTWVSPSTAKSHTRCNMSFSSKYVHFLSGRKLPIYDSYIWIVMIGYLYQGTEKRVCFKAPDTYKQFYEVFARFRTEFKLGHYSNYNIDKYLWRYGKDLINQIIGQESVNLEKAKSILKKRLTNKDRS